MKTIIVPTDFSETANYALEVAVQLSKKYDSKLIVLHLLEIPDHVIDDKYSTNDVANLTTPNNPPAALFYMKLAQKNFEKTRNLDFMQGVAFEEAVQNHLNFKEIGIPFNFSVNSCEYQFSGNIFKFVINFGPTNNK